MPISRVVVEGMEALKSSLTGQNGKKTFIFFTGSHVNGKSWCPDCVTAEPVIESVLSSSDVADVEATFITCFVGQRDYWKDPACPFRTDPEFKLTCVPTLIEYKNKHKRLLDSQLANAHLIKELIADE